MKTTAKPTHGRLIFIENATGRSITVAIGPWALLQHKKRLLSGDPQFRGGTLKIAYL